jgi:hypothetical protein
LLVDAPERPFLVQVLEAIRIEPELAHGGRPVTVLRVEQNADRVDPERDSAADGRGESLSPVRGLEVRPEERLHRSLLRPARIVLRSEPQHPLLDGRELLAAEVVIDRVVEPPTHVQIAAAVQPYGLDWPHGENQLERLTGHLVYPDSVPLDEVVPEVRARVVKRESTLEESVPHRHRKPDAIVGGDQVPLIGLHVEPRPDTDLEPEVEVDSLCAAVQQANHRDPVAE